MKIPYRSNPLCIYIAAANRLISSHLHIIVVFVFNSINRNSVQLSSLKNVRFAGLLISVGAIMKNGNKALSGHCSRLPSSFSGLYTRHQRHHSKSYNILERRVSRNFDSPSIVCCTSLILYQDFPELFPHFSFRTMIQKKIKK